MQATTSPSSSPSVTTYSPHQRWKVLAAGTLANAAFSMVFSGIPMTAIVLRSSYGLDNAGLGLMLGLMGLGIALSELPWGLLTDRWGDRPVLLTGLGGTSVTLAALSIWGAPHGGQIPPLAWLGTLLLLAGLLGGSVNGASGRAIMQWFDAGQRGLAMSIRQTAIPMGGALGALLLPWLALLLMLSGTAVSAWHGVAYTELATIAGMQQAGTALGLCNTLVFVANFLTPQAIASLLLHAPWAAIWMAASCCCLLCIPLLTHRTAAR